VEQQEKEREGAERDEFCLDISLVQDLILVDILIL
jgi:hypothetical protein